MGREGFDSIGLGYALAEKEACIAILARRTSRSYDLIPQGKRLPNCSVKFIVGIIDFAIPENRPDAKIATILIIIQYDLPKFLKVWVAVDNHMVIHAEKDALTQHRQGTRSSKIG